MKDHRLVNILWIAALIFLAAGILMSISTVNKLNEAKELISSKGSDIAKLHAMAQEIKLYHAARDEYGKLAAAELAPIKQLLNKHFESIDDLRKSRRELSDGWMLHEVEIALNDVSFARAMEAVAAVEKLRPPWRMVKCALTGSSRVDGAGNVVMTFHGITKSK